MYKCLINKQRKQLHDILISEGVDPSSTKWTNDAKGWTSGDVDTLEMAHCYFVIHADIGDVSIKCRPAVDGGLQYGKSGLSWDGVLLHFQAWARHVSEELAHVDPWEKYAKFFPPNKLGASNDNSAFSFKEAQQAEIAINELVQYLHENIDHYEEKAAIYDASFKRLIRHAQNGLGRIDWINQFIGTIISLCIALSLTPDTANQIWYFWLEKISTIYQLIT